VRKLVEEPKQLPATSQRVDHYATECRTDRMEPVFEGGHDPQIGRAPRTPEWILVFGGACDDQTAIDRYHVDRQQIDAGEPEFASQPAVPAAKRQTGYPGIGVCRRQTEGLRFTVELAEAKARLRPRGTRRGIDPDALQSATGRS
jgi:hypothetical protein